MILSCFGSQLEFMTDRHCLLSNNLVRAGDASLSHPFSIFPNEVQASAPENLALMLVLLLLSRERSSFQRSCIFPFPHNPQLQLHLAYCSFPWEAFVSNIFPASVRAYQVTSDMPDSFQPHELQPARLLCPWNSPVKNTGVSCYSLLLGIFLTQGLNPGLLHCRQILYCLSHQRSRL